VPQSIVENRVVCVCVGWVGVQVEGRALGCMLPSLNSVQQHQVLQGYDITTLLAFSERISVIFGS